MVGIKGWGGRGQGVMEVKGWVKEWCCQVGGVMGGGGVQEDGVMGVKGWGDGGLGVVEV